jgi:hypothetical protein
MEFQITQNFGESIKAFIYFSMPDNATLEEIAAKAIEVQKLDYKNRFSGFSGKSLEKKTIKIKEYKNSKVKKSGIQTEAKWRS